MAGVLRVIGSWKELIQIERYNIARFVPCDELNFTQFVVFAKLKRWRLALECQLETQITK
jgi:hypothetical protein